MKKVGDGVGQLSVHTVDKSRYLEEEEGCNIIKTIPSLNSSVLLNQSDKKFLYFSPLTIFPASYN